MSTQLKSESLLFIDEIQQVPEAFNIIRHIHEQEPDIAIIAAGSVLESIFRSDLHFPVGRVSFLMLRPVSFSEFLSAVGETEALKLLSQVPVPSFAHEKLLQLFHTYALIGGMPEVVAAYAAHRDLKSLAAIYDALIASYLEDVEKYAASAAQTLHIRHVISASFVSAGRRIKFENFGHSSYRSREMGEALRIAEKALLIHLVYPSTGVLFPLIPDKRKSPRLHVLDTGLMNYFLGLQHEMIGTRDLSSVYLGILIEHLIGQEMLSIQYGALSGLSFWTRDKPGSSAEVDFLVAHRGQVIPVETKSGATGHLKSLHQFMDLAPHTTAIRFYQGPVTSTQVKTPAGKSFNLINLPYYLGTQLEGILNEWQKTE